MNLSRTICVSLLKSKCHLHAVSLGQLFHKSIFEILDLITKRTLNTVGNILVHKKLVVPPPPSNVWIWNEGLIKETPPRSTCITDTIIDLPKFWMPTLPIITRIPPTIIENPITPLYKIEAARLIVIRRRKMKKHKLRKLRKRMKFEWAKVRQRRELRKEKEFQAKLISQIKEGEKFSAEKYVTEKIQQAIEKPLPRFWKGKRLPAFIIRQKLGLEAKH